MIAHTLEHGPGISGNPIILTGRFGVEIFFIISGLIIMLAAGSTSFDPKAFIVRRLWRLTPLYWLTTFLVAAMAIATPSALSSTVFDIGYFFKSLFFIPSPLPGKMDWRPLFKLGWTLNYEVFFYALVALTFWCKSAKLRGALIIAALSVFFAGSFFVVPQQSLIAYYANLNVLPFIAGVALALIGLERFVALPQQMKILFGLVAVVITLLFYQLPYDMTKILSGHILMALAALTIVIAFLCFEGRGKVGFLKWCGDISYSLYLTHMFVLGIGWAVIKRLHFAEGSVGATIVIVGMIVGSLVVAHLSYHFLERPLLKLFKKPPAPLAMGAATTPLTN